MAVVGLIWVLWAVPEPERLTRSRDTRLFREQLGDVLRQRELLRLDVGIFCLHLALTAMFVAVPMSLVQVAGLQEASHWWFYLSVMVLSFFAMVPFIIIAEKKRLMKQVFLGALLLLALASASVSTSQQEIWTIWISLFAFFMAFNFLEASLPSMVSKVAPAGNRGTAMGVYSTAQFMGAFVGGVAGGWCLSEFGLSGVYVMVAGIVLVWGLFAFGMRNPETRGVSQSVRPLDDSGVATLREQLLQLRGMEEVVILADEGVVHLKVSLTDFDDEGLNRALKPFR